MKEAMNNPKVSVDSVVSALPYIIYAYMYQPCVPQIYHEMKVKSLENIKIVLAAGTILASIIYITVGIFGYVTFASRPDVEELFAGDKNILSYYPGGGITDTCLVGLLLVLTFASPFSLVPSKIAIMELINKPG